MQLTDDSLFDGRLLCQQHKNGYRFSVDAVLVGHFCKPRAKDSVLDLGTGCGIIGLILCYLHPRLTVTGLELQPALAELALNNSSINNFQKRFTVQTGDLRQIRSTLPAESFDLVVSNPPYRAVGSGRINLGDESAIARHELACNLKSVVQAASFAVKNHGSVVCIYPAERLSTLLTTMEKNRLIAKRLQPVYSYPEDTRARLVMVEAVKNGGQGVHLLPPFYIYDFSDGPYSQEMLALYNS